MPGREWVGGRPSYRFDDDGPMTNERAEVALVDAGDGRRLERLGSRLVDRPAPVALGPKLDPVAWAGASLRYDAGGGWSGPAGSAEPWTVDVRGLTLELRATASGGVGLYPEHAANLGWLEARTRERLTAAPPAVAEPGADDDRPAVLNLFAHTGLATLAAARAGAAVAHVDAARASVAWARRNATLSGLDDRPIRWLVDDALSFAEREDRRGHRYAGFVIDPPSFGRAEGGRWRLRDDLTLLLDACGRVATDDPFVLLTAHTTGIDPEPMLAAVARAFGRRPGEPSAHRQALVAASGAILVLGWAIRLG